MRSVKPVVKVAAKAVAATAVFLVLGNLLILAASWSAQGATSSTHVDDVAGISNLTAVDSHLWRGGAPSAEGYRNLAAAGVTTVVDLRAEEGIEADTALVTELGMRLVSIPVRDGQAPSADKVAQFLSATRDSGGTVFVHCGAGVGRTGTMVGAYLVAGGGVGGAHRRHAQPGRGPAQPRAAGVRGRDGPGRHRQARPPPHRRQPGARRPPPSLDLRQLAPTPLNSLRRAAGRAWRRPRP